MDRKFRRKNNRVSYNPISYKSSIRNISSLSPLIYDVVTCNPHEIMFLFYGYHLLKTVQKYGPIEKFDILYHRNGPLAGKSRGYGFVTYKCKSDAEKALNALDGALFGSKHICMKWAHVVKKVCKILGIFVQWRPVIKNLSYLPGRRRWLQI